MSEVRSKPVEEPTDQQELTATAQIAIARALAATRVLSPSEIEELILVINKTRSEPKNNKK